MAIISTLICTTAGYIYPVYKSYKIIKYNPNESSKILVYWIVIGTFTVCQVIADKVLFWFPFYSEIKAIFVLWLILPATKGYQVIFNKFILNFLNKYEKQIDSGYDTILYLLKNKFIEVNQKLWILIQERIFNNDLKSKKPQNRVQQIEPIMKTKLIEDTQMSPVPSPVNHNNPVVQRVMPMSPAGNSPSYQRKAIIMPNSPALKNNNNNNNNMVEYKSPVQTRINNYSNDLTQQRHSNNNSNVNTPVMKNYKKTINNNNANNTHISDRYQKIKLYKEQLLDVLSQLEKDEEKEIKNYNKNNSKMTHHRNKSSLSNNVTNNNNNIISSKLSKNQKNDNTDFEYNLDEADYEAILSDSKAFVKNNNRGHSNSITNFLKNLKSR